MLRAANAPVPPFDFRLTLENMTATLGAYQEMVGDRFDFSPAAAEEIEHLREALEAFYGGVARLNGTEAGDKEARVATRRIMQLSRLLIPVNYAREGRFRQDPRRTFRRCRISPRHVFWRQVSQDRTRTTRHRFPCAEE